LSRRVFTFEVIDGRARRVDDRNEAGTHMLAMEDCAGRAREHRLQRLARTADELAAKEIVCHLRDTEEVFAARVEQDHLDRPIHALEGRV
jgi:hypothetical protein